eukprot:s819_g7.t1
MATKDGEIAQLRKEAMERDRVQEERIKKLEELLMQQSLQNQKLQSLLDSQLAEPYVLSAPLSSFTSASSAAPIASALNSGAPAFIPAAAPPYVPCPNLSGPSPHDVDGSANEMVLNRLPPHLRDDDIRITYCQNGGTSKVNPPNHQNENRTPMSSGTIPYGNIDGDPFDEGDNKGPSKGGGPPGGDGGGNGDGGGDGGDTPPASPSDAPGPSKPNKGKKKAPGGGDGGDDGDDPGKESDDSDEKFVRRMKKFLGGGFNMGNSDDKPKVKEADTIKLPAIPGPETYRTGASRLGKQSFPHQPIRTPPSNGSEKSGRKDRRLKPSGRWRRLQH